MKKLFAATMLVALAAPAAHAAAAGGFVHGGVSSASLRLESGPDFIEFDEGKGFNLTGGVRFNPGLMVRASYTLTNHDSISGCITGFGCGSSSNEDIDISETRVGFFWAPEQRGNLGWLVGGGYESIELEDNNSNSDAEADGGFLEAGLNLDAGTVATFTFGGAVLFLEDDDGEDTSGAEGRVGVTFHAGPVDIGLMARRVALETDYENAPDEEDEYDEVRLTIGGTWGYPN